jgi:hypothetical protein
MGALNLKKDSYKYRQWRLRHDEAYDILDNVPYRIAWYSESLENGVVRSGYSWLSNGSRYNRNIDLQRWYTSEPPLITSFYNIYPKNAIII